MKTLAHRHPFKLQIQHDLVDLFTTSFSLTSASAGSHSRFYSPLFLILTIVLTIYATGVNAEIYSTQPLSKLTADANSKHQGSYSTGRHSSDRYSRHSGSSVRWGVGYNNYWGPSVGIGWSNGWNNRWHNRWGYNGWGGRWGNGWRYPYRYDYYDRHYRDQYMRNQYMNNSVPRSNYVEPVTQVEPPKRTTTSIQYAKGLTHLPENARVIQRDGQTFYEWDGKEYYFDWSTERYAVLEAQPQ